eukprot:1400319-Prymnesium_polylepis.1
MTTIFASAAADEALPTIGLGGAVSSAISTASALSVGLGAALSAFGTVSALSLGVALSAFGTASILSATGTCGRRVSCQTPLGQRRGRQPQWTAAAWPAQMCIICGLRLPCSSAVFALPAVSSADSGTFGRAARYSSIYGGPLRLNVCQKRNEKAPWRFGQL